MPDRDDVIADIVDHIEATLAVDSEYVNIPLDLLQYALALLKEQDSCENCAITIEDRQPVVRCKDCKWYDEQISMCDNCKLPREQTFFCADGKRKERGETDEVD